MMPFKYAVTTAPGERPRPVPLIIMDDPLTKYILVTPPVGGKLTVDPLVFTDHSPLLSTPMRVKVPDTALP
jgi:hypothetical protein